MRQKVFAGLAAAVYFVAGAALAQTQQPTQPVAPMAPAGFPVGPLVVYPGIDLAVGHDDNLFLRPANRSSSNFTIVSPYVRAEARPGPHKFDVALRIDDGRYHSSSADNYTDYWLLGNGDLVFSGRMGLKLRAELRHGHDPRGSTDRGISATPDEYDNTGVDGVFRYGAPGARGRIEIDAGAFARRYTNNRLTTVAADRDTKVLGGTFFWRVMPRTELLFQAQHRNIDYQLATSTLSSTEDRLYIGAKWEATAATSGYAKFGRLNKNFNSAARADFSGSSWDVGVRWSPLTYSVFDLYSSKQANESTGFGDTTVTKLYGITWSHAWTSRLRTQVLASLRNDNFNGAGVTRQDDTISYGLKAAYDFRRWLRFGAEYTHFTRDSNLNAFDYKRNLLLFTVGATL